MVLMIAPLRVTTLRNNKAEISFHGLKFNMMNLNNRHITRTLATEQNKLMETSWLGDTDRLTDDNLASKFLRYIEIILPYIHINILKKFHIKNIILYDYLYIKFVYYCNYNIIT